MKKLNLLALLLVFITFSNNAQIYTPSGLVQGSTGNNYVGIGTSSPTCPLEISAGSLSKALQVNGTTTGANWSGRIITGGPSNVIVMGQYNDHAWFGAHNAALSSWADLYINPEGVSGKKVYIGAKGSRENTIFTIDNASGNSYFMNGKVGIGTSSPSALLTVNGKIECEEIEVLTIASNNIKTNSLNLKLDNAADYVFKENYNLMSLSNVESFINKNRHLPGIPSAEEFKDKGMDVSEMSNLLLEKIEELTLYTIKQQKLINELQEKVDNISK